MSKTIRIALLLCATPIPTVLAEHGDYTAMFTRVFRDSLPKESGCEVHIDPYDVRTKMEYPDESQMGGDDGYKAVVMTGSGALTNLNLSSMTILDNRYYSKAPTRTTIFHG